MATRIEQWLVAHLAEKLTLAAGAVNPAERFRRLGLDSLGATSMLVGLGRMLGRELSPTLAWEFPNPTALARHLAGWRETTKQEAGPRGPASEPIAIVGLACRLPGAAHPRAFWELLIRGGDAITEVPPQRWSLDLFDPDLAAPGKMSTRWGGFLDEVAAFDPAFFGISPREAALMDPQQRLMLELSWEALEDSGVAPSTLKDTRTGVFFGAMWMDYARLDTREGISQHSATGQDLSIIPARVSYTLGLTGPSIAVNTACSSSLVAVHLACQSLLRGESRLVLAGGVNLLLIPDSTIAMSKFGAMAPDGRCKAFDARANGYVRGEGGGVIALKRLSDAVAAGDRVYCVIRGSAVNNDGFSNGLTAPSPRAQEAVLRDACDDARVSPRDVQYVEAHGTGTQLGDPIEAGALGAVLGAGRAPGQPLRIGSVKTNIGHLEAAAGVAGLIKVALAMHHGALPRSLHFERPNPHIAFAALGLRVQDELVGWEGDGRLAGVSSFGFGGTNSHVILESVADDAQLCRLAAGDGAGLGRAAAALAARAAPGGPPLAELCADAGLFLVPGAPAAAPMQRAALVVRTRGELARGLAALTLGAEGEPASALMGDGRRRRVAFLYTGQGAQYPGMGRRLYACEPAFRAALDRCAARLESRLQRPLLSVMWPEPGSADVGLLDRTAFTQPALFALEYALTELMASWGIVPDIVVGHSVGEIAAACAAGSLSLDDALELVTARGRLMDQLPSGGAMASIAAPATDVAARIAGVADRLTIAAVNGPASVVISGDADHVARVVAAFAAEGVATRRLVVSHAFHSPLMAPIREDLRRVAASLRCRAPRRALVSNLTDGDLSSPEHWVRHAEGPVMFAAGLAEVFAREVDVLVELGPQPVLLGLAKDQLRPGHHAIATLDRSVDDVEAMAHARGRLFTLGLPSAEKADARAELVVLSGKSDRALDAAAGKLRAHVEAHPEQSLSDLAYALATTRTHHEHRLTLAVRSRDELLAALEQQPVAGVRGSAQGGKVVFVFPGQGSQWVGMGRELLASEPVFRDAIEACDAAIALETGWSLVAELTGASSLLPRIDVVQPVLFAIEVALAALWRSWGVEPDCVVGHSMGEVAAAHVAGALSLTDACAVICRRSILLRRISGQGEMAVVELSVAEAEAAIVGYETALSVAVSNSPRSTVLSGSPEALSAVLATLEGRGVFCRRVKVDVASHSPQVDVLRADLLAALSGLSPAAKESQVAMRSTVTGAAVAGPQLVASYWADNLRQPVRFAEVIAELMRDGHTLFVEMSPHPLLVPSIDEMRQGRGAALGSLRREQPERRSLLEALGALHAHGHPLDWQRVFPSAGRRVGLPSYAWQREPHWLEAAPLGSGRSHAGGHPLLGLGLTLSTHTGTRIWQTSLDVKRLRWLADHQVQGAAVFPGAGYIEMALAAAGELLSGELELVELKLVQALIVPASGPVEVQLVLEEQSPGCLSVRIASGQGDDFIEHARASVRLIDSNARQQLAALDVAAVRSRLGGVVPPAAAYDALREMGLQYGPAFQGIVEMWRGGGEALGRIALPVAAGSASAYRVHPALLDACFQLVPAAVSEAGTWLAVEVGLLRLHGPLPDSELWCHAQVSPLTAMRRRCDLLIADATGRVVAEVSNLIVQQLALARAPLEDDRWFFGVEWERSPPPPARSAVGRWLLLGDGALAAQLKLALEAAGHSAVHGRADEEGIRRWGSSPPTGIVHLRSLDGSDAAGIEAALARGCDSVLDVVHTVTSMGWRDPPRLWLVTRGAQAVQNDVACEQAPLLGLARVIAIEHAALRCARIDLDPASPAGELASLRGELLGNDDEDEVALRGDQRLVARLARVQPEAARAERSEPAQGRPFALAIEGAAGLERPVLRVSEGRQPQAGEVLIDVEAAGIGLIDLRSAAADASGERGIGGECAGRVVAVGEGVVGLVAGDEVLALARGAIASRVVASSLLVVRRPSSLSMAQAAALPSATLTAWYALDKVAHLSRGERVLIHAASGGVGMAAIHWARHVGAEVIATAGSPQKRALLEALGVRLISDSRSERFVADVRAWTGGEGVDVILNPLSGQLRKLSIGLLRPLGRFVDLAPADATASDAVPSARNLSFAHVDLRAMSRQHPAVVGKLLAAMMQHVAAGALPLPQVESVPVSRAGEAFSKLAHAAHTGKLVLTLRDPAARVQVAHDAAVLRADGSYLVTGGLGGLGLSLAAWLADNGAGHVVLFGRTGAQSAARRAAVAAIEAKGARVTVVSGDVAVRADVKRALDGLSGPPLRGIFHAAGVFDRGMIAQQTPARLRTVMAPKVLGAWHLHELSKDAPLDHFVMYSSAAGLLGAPGQGNYAAANTFLDALAWHRRASGLAGVSIDWGLFSEVGLAVSPDNSAVRLDGRGWNTLSPAQGLTALGRVLAGGLTQVGAMSFDVLQWVEFFPVLGSSKRLSRLIAEQRAGTHRAGEDGLLARLAAAESPAARVAMLARFVSEHASQVLRIPIDRLSATAPLSSLGMDSLMGLELRNRIEAGLGMRAPATLLWTFPTIEKLAAHLAGPSEGPALVRPAAPVDDVDEPTAHMDSSELMRYVDDLLEGSGDPETT